MKRLTGVVLTMTLSGVGLAQPVAAPNETGIYTTVTASEHADEGRSHRFGAAVFTGALDNAENNRVSTRVAPRNYPGTFNLVTRNPDELFVYFGSYGEIEGANGPMVARLDARFC